PDDSGGFLLVDLIRIKGPAYRRLPGEPAIGGMTASVLRTVEVVSKKRTAARRPPFTWDWWT
ncbi:MAG TPA: hypothetical protein VIU40_15070, partial [Geobacteraceae bacterium]